MDRDQEIPETKIAVKNPRRIIRIEIIPISWFTITRNLFRYTNLYTTICYLLCNEIRDTSRWQFNKNVVAPTEDLELASKALPYKNRGKCRNFL